MSPTMFQELQEKTRDLQTKEDITHFLQELGASLMSRLETPPIPAEPVKPTAATVPVETSSPIVRKYESLDGDPFFEEVITSLYAKGLSIRAIQNHMLEAYNVEIGNSKVSEITDKILPQMHEWEQRPLSPFYPFVYLDGIHFQVRDAGKPAKRCGYTVLGINEDGEKEILGIWVGETEGAKFWMHVLNDIKTRGVEDILICCVDGLKGFPEAINAVFPKTDIQHCIVHQVRYTMKCVSHKDRKRFCADLRAIYTAVNEARGREALEEMKLKWSDYGDLFKPWEEKWSQLATFFTYGPAIRKLIYTTNPIENLHRQFRRVNKTKDATFPHEEALKKLLYLAQRDIAKRWTTPMNGWGEIIRQLAIIFPDRIGM